MYEQYLNYPHIPCNAVLKRIMQKERLSQRELARRSGIVPQRINDLLSERRRITADMSIWLLLYYTSQPRRLSCWKAIADTPYSEYIQKRTILGHRQKRPWLGIQPPMDNTTRFWIWKRQRNSCHNRILRQSDHIKNTQRHKVRVEKRDKIG